MAAVGRKEDIIKAPDKRDLAVGYFVLINSEQLCRQLFFIDPIIMVKACLRRPADMQG